jgi:hypothetical protein
VDPKLSIELVPRALWGKNLRSSIARGDWDKCKAFAKEQSGSVCQLCGGVGSRYPIDCHERWEYDVDERGRHLQRLVGLIALCPPCHQATHYGRASALGHGDVAEATLMRVNDWTSEQVAAHINEAVALWDRRNGHEWLQDLSWVTRTLSIPLGCYAPDGPDDFTSRVERDGETGKPLPDQPPWVQLEEYEHALYEQMLADRD